MNLTQLLEAIREEAKSYKNGTQITHPIEPGTYESVNTLLELTRAAKRAGATPYEIERAFAGEIIGSSF